MSSDLQSALELLRMNDSTSLAIVIAVGYDYILNFSREIDYIWCRPWSWVSTIYVIVRYLGLCSFILAGIGGSTFMPGPVKVSTVTYLVTGWTFTVFFAAADLVMVLRVYAMWNRSKTILGILLFIYVAQVIISVVFGGIFNNPNTYLSLTVVQILNLSFCSGSSNVPPLLTTYATIPRFVLGAAILILAVLQTVKQSSAMYRATKQWQLNRYMGLFAREGVLYFFVNLLANIMHAITNQSSLNNTAVLFLTTFSYLLLCPVMPRFIISVRELFERDLHGRWQDVDTGFGVSSRPNTDGNAAVSTIAFADVTPGQGEVVERDADDSEAIRLEVVGEGAPQV